MNEQNITKQNDAVFFDFVGEFNELEAKKTLQYEGHETNHLFLKKIEDLGYNGMKRAVYERHIKSLVLDDWQENLCEGIEIDEYFKEKWVDKQGCLILVNEAGDYRDIFGNDYGGWFTDEYREEHNF